MEVDKENMGNEADASRSEAASVCAATEASITRSQYQTSDCPEGLEVQESAAVSPEQGAAKLTSEEALRRLERVAIGGTGPPGLMGEERRLKGEAKAPDRAAKLEKKRGGRAKKAAELQRLQGVELKSTLLCAQGPHERRAL